MTSPDVTDAGAGKPDNVKPSSADRMFLAPELLAALIFLLGLLTTIGLWRNAQNDARSALQTEFDFQVRQTSRHIEERMATYEQVQRGVQAFLLGSPDIRREDFRLYVESLRLQDTYPGIQGIAISKIVHSADRQAHEESVRKEGFPDYKIFPVSERAIYSSITHIEPFSGLNLRALGFDMLTDPIRREAMERARDTGQAAASGKVKLIQENGKDEQPGLVMYFPVYRRGAPTLTVADRRASLFAWIGAPFRMNDLMEGLGGERSSDIILAIYDGNEVSERSKLYYSLENASAPTLRYQPSFFHTERRILVGGRPWTLEIRSSPSFEKRLGSAMPTIIALGGVLTSAMLSALVWALASGRRRALSLANDMTHHLSESEFRWKYALEGAGDGVWDMNTETGEMMYSKRWKEMLGYADTDIRGQRSEWERLIHPDDKERASRVAAQFLEGRDQGYFNEFRLRCKDGSWKWILARGTAVSRKEDGTVLRAIGTHTDITPRKQDEDALRESNNRLAMEQRRIQVILENSHDAFVAWDASGRVTDWNAKAEKIFCWTAGEAIGTELPKLIVPPDARAEHRAEILRITSSRVESVIGQVIEMDAVDKFGNLIPVELAVAGIPQTSGYAGSAFIRDIRERKAAEKNEAERARALEETRTALQHAQKLEAVGKLTGGVAHDFNNVLQTVGGNIELLKHILAGQPAVEKRLTSIMAAVDRGAKLSSQLLAFARRQPLQPIALNPLRVIQAMDDLLRRALGETIELETRATKELWNIFADRGQLENVVLNLAINARDAMPNGGRLLIEMKNVHQGFKGISLPTSLHYGEYVQIAVIDNGIGMAPEIAEQAFEPFFTTKSIGEGTGLGLSMAYGFVTQSGGHIRLDSEAGRGTTITIYLPRVLQQEEPDTSPDQGLIIGGHETILVVEDDSEVRMTVVGMLTRLGYKVMEAHDGSAGLEMLKNNHNVDLLFTDVVMPGPVSSTQLAQEASQLLPGLGILFTSGYTRNALTTGGRLEKGVQLLSKPYNEEQLAKKVRQVLTSRSLLSTASTK
ncbi:CHASE domain-containing protein [Herbaspirillum sp. GCM10030257]|uniref:CHASE domain-containing protein n=1 Tax=Herbaspirillum sp. GCM10030257 TaxID=3273393 RepID=UPI00360DF4DE